MSKIEAIKRCALWLSECLRLGWRKDQLDVLEAIWWQFRTEANNYELDAPTTGPARSEGGTPKEDR